MNLWKAVQSGGIATSWQVLAASWWPTRCWRWWCWAHPSSHHIAPPLGCSRAGHDAELAGRHPKDPLGTAHASAESRREPEEPVGVTCFPGPCVHGHLTPSTRAAKAGDSRDSDPHSPRRCCLRNHVINRGQRRCRASWCRQLLELGPGLHMRHLRC